MSTSTTLCFKSICTSVLLLFFAALPAFAQPNFTFTSNTGNFASVAVPTTATVTVGGASLAAGDSLGCFTPNGLCVGAGVWTSGGTVLLTFWGDNDQTPAVDGIQTGQQMTYRLWRATTNTIHTTSSVSYSLGNGLYVSNGFYAIATMIFNGTASASGQLATPTLITPADGTANVSTTPTFTWQSVTGASTYRIEYSTNSNLSSPIVLTTSGTSVSPSAQLALNTMYYWRVRAESSSTTSSFSASRTFTTVTGLGGGGNSATGYTIIGQVYFQGITIANGANAVRVRRSAITVELRSGTPTTSGSVMNFTPTTSAYIVPAMLSSTGTFTATFANIVPGNYWLVLRHGGNTPAVWPVQLSAANDASDIVDFTAFANVSAMPQLSTFGPVWISRNIGGSTRYLIRSGDLNGDRAMNVSDFGELQLNLNYNSGSTMPELGN